MKIKEFIIENKIPIVFGLLGLAGAGAIAYYFFNQPKEQKVREQQKEPTMTAASSLKQQSISSRNNSQHESIRQQQPKQIKLTYNEKFTKIINKVRSLLDASNGQITPQIIKAIIKSQYQLSVQDLRALTYKSRRQRRQNIQDGLQYAKILTKYQYDLQQIQQKHLGVILARFNIDKATWKQATNDWQEKTPQGSEGMSELINDQERKLLLSYRLVHSKPKELLFIQNVLKFKIKQLQVLNPQNFGVDLAADNAAKYDMIQTYINDLVFQKFNIQQQDVEYSIQLLNQKEKEKIIQLQDKISQLMLRFIEDEDDDEKQKQSRY